MVNSARRKKLNNPLLSINVLTGLRLTHAISPRGVDKITTE